MKSKESRITAIWTNGYNWRDFAVDFFFFLNVNNDKEFIEKLRVIVINAKAIEGVPFEKKSKIAIGGEKK
jgi:hypothetical protein